MKPVRTCGRDRGHKNTRIRQRKKAGDADSVRSPQYDSALRPQGQSRMASYAIGSADILAKKVRMTITNTVRPT